MAAKALSNQVQSWALAEPGGQVHALFPQAGQPFPVLHVSLGMNRLVVLMYVRFPLSLRDIKDLRIKGCVEPTTRRCEYKSAC